MTAIAEKPDLNTYNTPTTEETGKLNERSVSFDKCSSKQMLSIDSKTQDIMKRLAAVEKRIFASGMFWGIVISIIGLIITAIAAHPLPFMLAGAGTIAFRIYRGFGVTSGDPEKLNEELTTALNHS